MVFQGFGAKSNKANVVFDDFERTSNKTNVFHRKQIISLVRAPKPTGRFTSNIKLLSNTRSAIKIWIQNPQVTSEDLDYRIQLSYAL